MLATPAPSTGSAPPAAAAPAAKPAVDREERLKALLGRSNGGKSKK